MINDMSNETAANLLYKLKDDDYTLYVNKCVMDMAINKAIEVLDVDKWIPASDNLPNKTGDYLCTVEWYGTSTKKLLISNGHEIERRIMFVHYLNSEKSFKELDRFCTYKVLAWKLQEPYSL